MVCGRSEWHLQSIPLRPGTKTLHPLSTPQEGCGPRLVWVFLFVLMVASLSCRPSSTTHTLSSRSNAFGVYYRTQELVLVVGGEPSAIFLYLINSSTNELMSKGWGWKWKDAESFICLFIFDWGEARGSLLFALVLAVYNNTRYTIIWWLYNHGLWKGQTTNWKERDPRHAPGLPYYLIAVNYFNCCVGVDNER